MACILCQDRKVIVLPVSLNSGETKTKKYTCPECWGGSSVYRTHREPAPERDPLAHYDFAGREIL